MRTMRAMKIDYGKAFKTARAARGMKQKDVAARAGLAQNSLSLLESGARRPSTETIDALAKVLAVPVWALVVLGSDDIPDAVRGAAMAMLTKGPVA